MTDCIRPDRTSVADMWKIENALRLRLRAGEIRICLGYVLYAEEKENILRFRLCAEKKKKMRKEDEKRLRIVRLAVVYGYVILGLRVLSGEANV